MKNESYRGDSFYSLSWSGKMYMKIVRLIRLNSNSDRKVTSVIYLRDRRTRRKYAALVPGIPFSTSSRLYEYNIQV
jgi:hypothetical protein